MALFSRKSKKAEKQAKKESAKEEPAKRPYVPRHAASDAFTNNPSSPNHRNGQRQQPVAAAAGSSGDAAPTADRRKHYTTSGGSSSFLTDPRLPYVNATGGSSADRVSPGFMSAAAPRPQQIVLEKKYGVHSSAAVVTGQSRTNSSGQPTNPYDATLMGNPKMQFAVKERGGHFSHSESTDSGYGSGVHSSAASATASHSPSSDSPPLPANTGAGFLPKMNLPQALTRDVDFLAKFSSDESTSPVRELKPATRAEAVQPGGAADSPAKPRIRQRINENFSRPYLDRNVLSKSSKPYKQTRFEEPVNESVSTGSNDDFILAVQPTLPPQESLPASAKPVQSSQIQQAEQRQTSSQELARGWASQRANASTPVSQPQSFEPQLHRVNTPVVESPRPLPERLASASPYRHSMPQIGTPHPIALEGLKVNKRGLVLDEEGDPIGELVEGDLIDCVRQRVNGVGEVLDEYGNVVGRVRVLSRTHGHGMSTTPQTEYSSSPAFPQHRYRGSFSAASPILTPFDRSSASPFSPRLYQPQNYTWPSNQYATPLSDGGYFAQALARLPAVTPLGVSSEVVMELDGTSELPKREVIPDEAIIDLSDIFLPASNRRPSSPSAPQIPERSPLRPATPSSLKSKKSRSPSLSHCSLSGGEDVPGGVAESVKLPVPEFPKVVNDARTADPEPSTEPASDTLLSELKKVPSVGQQTALLKEPSPPASPITAELLKTHPLFRSTSQGATSAESTAPLQILKPTFTRHNSLPRPSTAPLPSAPSSLEGNGPDDRSPFAYKGEVPSPNGPSPFLQQRRAASPKAPPLPPFPRSAFTGGSNAGPLAALNGSVGVGPVGGSPAARRLGGNTLAPPATTRPGLKSRHTIHSPLVRSPLSSQGTSLSTISASSDEEEADHKTPETTPPDSDASNSDDGKGQANPAMYLAAARSRALSVRSTAPSIRSLPAGAGGEKPRTYFTHTGRVVVKPGQPPPSARPSTDSKAASIVTETQSLNGDKKKNRLSFFGKKAKA